MAEPFIGEIRTFAFNVIPRGWMPCDGRLLPINQNQALFSILGTTYGGNGTNNFALPNLQGRAAVHVSPVMPLGQASGEEVHVLQANEIPPHTHQVLAGSDVDEVGGSSPAGRSWGTSFVNNYAAAGGAAMKQDALAAVGGQPHGNKQPYLVLQFCIAISGIYPPRN
ncbi:phage tail protein [Cohnella pontilimi]|uniref:Phage tail protein n=1 Tax=Cohnella pontilimi TaxID=2564100 RepID=A0A4U0FD91_9BACL|nr:tail fiber protein [Cohnella pontilimi]TJY42785.1 phage tail protein [Cohnella pontilimi]